MKRIFYFFIFYEAFTARIQNSLNSLNSSLSRTSLSRSSMNIVRSGGPPLFSLHMYTSIYHIYVYIYTYTYIHRWPALVFRSWAAWRHFGLPLPRTETAAEMKRRFANVDCTSPGLSLTCILLLI
jgi:hypothetical protein